MPCQFKCSQHNKTIEHNRQGLNRAEHGRVEVIQEYKCNREEESRAEKGRVEDRGENKVE